MKAANELRAALPAEIQETLTHCEHEGRIATPEFEAAANKFNKRHSGRLDLLPIELNEAFQALESDSTPFMTMFGLSDFNVSGSLKDWSIEKDLKKLIPEVVPGGILLRNGYFDVAQDQCMYLILESHRLRSNGYALGSVVILRS